MKYTIDEADRIVQHLLRKKQQRIDKLVSKGNKMIDKERTYVEEETRLIDAVDSLVASLRSVGFGKKPPEAVDLERAIIGAVILEKGAIEAVSFLRADHFYMPAHQIVWQAILDLRKSSAPIDSLTVVAQLRKKNLIDKIGGPYYIVELTSMVSSAANVEYHARIVVEFAVKRFLIMVGQRILIEASEDSIDVFELFDAIVERMDQIKSENFKNQKTLTPVTNG